MSSSDRPPPDAIARSVVVIPTLACVAVGGVAAVLLGIWLLVPEMKWFSGPTMKSNTALALLCASVSLWLLRAEGGAGAALRRRWAAVLAVVLILVGAMTTLEYVLDSSFGIDELIADDYLIP